MTRARINMPEIAEAIRAGRLAPDDTRADRAPKSRVTKIAIEPVWHLPASPARFGISTTDLRRGLFEQTGGMFPELVTRPDLEVFLPPIGGMSVYIMGDPTRLGRADTRIACRVHDECNGSDVFGSDICTCRPYLAHGMEVCVATAQQGGVGVVVYNRKEGRALGEVTKFLVYNARKRQAGGDRADAYFERTECVAGVADMRVQELMPDVLHWLGIARIDRLVSMSHMKYAPIVASGIEVLERVPIPDHLIPADASVEMDAKKASGYFASGYPGCCRAEAAQGARVARLNAERRSWPGCARRKRSASAATPCWPWPNRMPWRTSRSMPRGWTMPADYIAAVIRENYPDLAIPYHGRWRHFAAGGIDRWAHWP